MELILLSLGVALGAGKLTALLCEKIKLPAVVGEISAGILLANSIIWFPHFEVAHALGHNHFLRELSEIGIILMLFVVGLESDVQQIKKVGGRALAVAVVGVGLPFALVMIAWKFGFVPEALPNGKVSFVVPLFVGATLVATSVGITARILQDAGQIRSKTGQIILSAAVIDDVLGLVMLALASSLAAGAALTAGALGGLLGKVVLFFVIAIPFGLVLNPMLVNTIRKSFPDRSKLVRVTLTSGLVLCFLYSAMASYFGLAAIVGAFFAGLLIDERKMFHVREQVEPIVEFLAPLFFVLIGAQINMSQLAGAGGETLSLILVLTVLALIGKYMCGYVAGKGVDKVAVGLGMAPRGEVGLIFAVTGKQLGVISDQVFGVLVFVVLLTTLIPSIALDLWLKRPAKARKRK